MLIDGHYIRFYTVFYLIGRGALEERVFRIYYSRKHHFTVYVAGDDHAFADGLKLAEIFLYLLGVNILSVGKNNNVFEPAGDKYIALVVDVSQIAGSEKAVRCERCGRCLRLL